jgi:hypothetical protein
MPSSVISSMSYNKESLVLKIVFVSGMVYEYFDVPEKEYNAMKSSGSKGTYLNKEIKGKYRYKKIK